MVIFLEAKGRVTPLFYVSAFALCACVVLGGGAGPGFLSEAVLELICVPILFISIWRLTGCTRSPNIRGPIFFCVIVAIFVVAELAPLPPGIWTHLPGREPLITAYKVLGVALPWMSLSMTPEASWLSGLSLLPALSVFLCVLCLNARERRLLTLVALGGAIVNALLGLAQISGGSQSPLRFYEGTESEAVGFLSNRNHLAAILYAAMPFAAAWTVSAGLGERVNSGASPIQPRGSLLTLLMVLCAFFILMAGEIMARSRAGVALTIGVIIASVALVKIGRRSSNATAASRIIFGGAIAALFLSNFALYRLAERFETEHEPSTRTMIAQRTLVASASVAPIGAGLGSFVQFYQLFERPRDLGAGTYVNHAHNDYLELWTETGIVGVIFICVALFWIVRRALFFWRQRNENVTQDVPLGRASSIVIAALLLHSLVDYPLRANAVLAFFALACALLSPPADLKENVACTNAGPLAERRASPRRRTVG